MLTVNRSHMCIRGRQWAAANIAGVLTEDEARRLASNIAKLPNSCVSNGSPIGNSRGPYSQVEI